MIFHRFEHEGLAHHAYAIGCGASGEVAIVDPGRAVDVYLDFAAEHDLAVSHVLETHIHADYASGARELAERAGVQVAASGYDEGERYQLRFPHRDLRDGDALQLGAIRIEPRHTPGHTPEHLSFLVFDESRSRDVPLLLASGDFLFVGSLGRPDLLGAEATRELACQLFRSCRERLAGLPDGLEIHPAHGAGSLCGSAIGGRASSTLGYERATNPYLDPRLDEASFVSKLLADLPPRPDYYARMKQLNSDGPPLLGTLPAPEPLGANEVAARLERGEVMLDLRDPFAYGAGHLPGSLSLGAGPLLAPWAGWVVPPDRTLLLVARDRHEADLARRELGAVGLDRVAGWLRGGVDAWVRSGRELAETPQLAPRELHRLLERGEELAILDVRSAREWSSGHLARAAHIAASELLERLDEVPRGRPLAVICGSGYRSSVAISVLERHGFRDLYNVAGGMGAWLEARLGLDV